MRVGVIGLGYVGLPLAAAFAQQGVDVVGIDIDQRKVDAVAAGDSYIDGLDDATLSAAGARINATTDYDALLDASAVVILSLIHI